MVAVVSGSGLGLFNSSVSALGANGSSGDGRVGRGNDRVYINSSNGNLIVQSMDESLTALGLDFAAVRTYNSQGLLDEDNNDQWRLGVHQKLSAVTGGSVNTAGSRLTKTFGDGSEIVYAYNTTRARYESTDGDNANDFLIWNGSIWTWTDGTTRNTEEYANVNGTQRIRFARDADGNTITYTYANASNPNLLSSISMAGSSVQTVNFDYSGTNLSAIRVVSYDRAGTTQQTQTLTRYYYDASNRLKQVVVDLTPTDNAASTTDTNADGYLEAVTEQSYVTSYYYDGTSKRIAQITQADGSSVSFTYQELNGQFRLGTATDAAGRQTTFTYTDPHSSGGTSATAPALSGQYSTSDSTSFPLTGSLVTPAAGWETTATRDANSAASNDPRIVYDSAGDGLLIYRTGSDIRAQRYTRATNMWSAEITLDARTGTTYAPSLSIDQATGNAIAAWAQSDGTAISIYAARYTASTNSWSTAALVDVAPAGASFPVNTASDTVVTAINGTRAAVAWHHNQATSGSVYDLYVARFDGSAWIAPALAEARSQSAAQASLALDDLGNLTVAFQQSDGVANSLYVNRFTASTATWSGASLRESSSTAINNPQISFDTNGNGLLIYRTGNDIRAQRYTRSTNAWATEVTLDTRTSTTYPPKLAMDYATGNAVAAWVQSDGSTNSVYTARYTASSNTWTTAVTVDGSLPFNANSTISALYASMNNGRAVVAWQQNQASSGSVFDVYAARFDGSSWLAPVALENSTANAASVGVAIDSSGNAAVSFRQSDGSAQSIYVARFNLTAPMPYFVVPGGATWQSVAAAMYGSGADTAAAGAELASRMNGQSLSAGRLYNFPSSLTVTSTVAAYTTILSSDTSWGALAQRVYGNQNAGVVQAMQSFAGTLTLPGTGNRLPINTSLGYTEDGADSTIYRTVTIDSYNSSVTYRNDTQGRLEGVLRTTGTVTLETRYAYDAVTGNVSSITEDPAGLNRVTNFAYDAASGNLLTARDNAGNTVVRTYNGNNQLLTETRYTVPDPDAINTGASPSGALVTRYAYDLKNHLRFVITPDGRVTEHQYNQTTGVRLATFSHLAAQYTATAFTESDLESWVAGAGAGVRERTDYSYDWRGNLQTATRWAATTATGAGTGASSVTQFVYDQRGQLIQTIDPRGSATTADGTTQTLPYAETYLYDGLGRLTRSVEWLKGTDSDGAMRTRTTTTQYNDIGRLTTITFDNAQQTVKSYNVSGELVGINNGALGSTSYSYDAAGRLRVVRDPNLVNTVAYYDNAGRLIGSVDGDGSVTELIYDATDRVIKTVRHSVPLSATTLASLVDGSGNATSVDFATLLSAVGTPDTDQVARNVYDSAGRLVYTIDEVGAVQQKVYDGANRVVTEIAYFNPIAVPRTTGQVLVTDLTDAASSFRVIADSANDRRMRHFFDGSGLRIATLDSAGYLTEYKYDNGGHLIERLDRANQVASGLRAAGTLADLQSSAGFDTTSTTNDTEQDARTWYYYDMQGRQVGVLDAEGAFTRTVYDLAGNATSTVRYERPLTAYGSARPALATIDTDLSGSLAHTTVRTFDGANRLVRETDLQGTITKFEYDGMDNVLSVRRAEGDATDERWTMSRYDGLGRVTQELTAEGRVALTALGSSPNSTAVEDVWNRFGVRYTYDAVGNRIRATVRPDDTQTNVSRYYYDADGRLRFEVNPLGERKEYRYNALGQLTDELRYHTRISTSGLDGGLLTSSLITTLTGSTNALDSRTTHTYSRRGERLSSTTLEGAFVSQQFNVFGEVSQRTTGAGAANVEAVTSTFGYTARGQLRTTTRMGTLLETREYDAFGREWKVTDARGKISYTEYDRVGRTIASVDQLGNRSTISYDGYGRVYRTDEATAGTNYTTYTYDEINLTMTVDTPEGVRIVTTYNRHDETTNITVGTTAGAVLNTKGFTFDKNGQLLFAYEGGMQVEGRTYDRGGRQVTQVDGRGITTTIVYDTADRVYRSIVDSVSGGLQRTTTYTYDGMGRVSDVLDPMGVVTHTDYDRDGRVSMVSVDPSGLNLRTKYDYNSRNDQVTVTEMYGTALPSRTQYLYDSAGRRIEEIVDPTSLGGTLNIRTQYKYDNNDNVTRKIDTFGNSCWYVYDDANRLIYELNAIGAVRALTYDADGRVASERRFIAVTSVAALAGNDAPTVSDFAVPSVSANDRYERIYYDRDGRAKYTIDGTGTITQRTIDAAGNVTRARVISAVQLTGAYAQTSDLESAIGSSVLNGLAAADQVQWTVYDERGRAEFSVVSMNGSVGSVIRNTYDGNGNVTAVRVFSAERALALATDVATLRTWAGSNANATYDQVTRTWYDKAGRERFLLDAEGYATETRYNDTTRAATTLSYARRQTGMIALGATTTDTDANGALLLDATFDRKSYRWVDAAGRSRFELDASGYLTENGYNDNTGATTSIAYANKPTTALDASSQLTAVSAAVSANTTLDRVSMEWQDAAGRTRFKVDGEGYLVETRYDAIAGSRSVIRYDAPFLRSGSGLPLMPTAATTLADMASKAESRISGDLQITRTEFNEVGGVTSVTQAYSSAEAITEHFAYNGAGDKTGYTNQRGTSNGDAAFTWTYTYDANGRLLTETTPAVTYYTQTVSDAALGVSGTTTTAGIVTRFQYDALGNLTHKYEADGTALQRLTRYEYDAQGRQVRVFHPAVRVYDPSLGDTTYGAGGVISRPEQTTPTVLTTETWYDALGNAFRNRDLSGNYTFKTYDRLGRVQYEIDARKESDVGNTAVRNAVTLHDYDAFGNQTKLTKFFNGLTARPSITAATLRAGDFGISAHADDRSITTVFDKANNVTTMTQPSLANGYYRDKASTAGRLLTASQTTVMEYNAFGEVQRKRVLLATGPDVYADTRYYYDRRGMRVAEIDPEKFLTASRFDASGDMVGEIQYANRITGAIGDTTYAMPTLAPTTLSPGAAGTELGFDRETLYGYNRLNRMVSMTEVNSEYSYYDGNILRTGYTTLTTTYGYDAVGNQIRVTDPENNSTYTYYDVLGRAIAIVEPARVLGDGTTSGANPLRTGGTTVRPSTRMLRDALGNVIQTIESKNDVSGTLGTTTLPTFTPSTEDRQTDLQYDALGRVIRTEDPTGADRHTSYYGSGKLAKEWQVVTSGAPVRTDTLVSIYRYDAQGRQVETIAPVSLDDGTLLRTTRTSYNQFGDLVTKGVVDPLDPDAVTDGTQEYFDYDQAGRVWRTNSGDGVNKVFLYDLAGRATVELRSQTLNLKAGYASLQAVMAEYASNPGSFMRTETVYDATGNVLERYTPTYTVNHFGLPGVAADISIGTVSGSPAPTQNYLYWAGTDLVNVTETFEYRTAGGAWTAATIVALPNGYLGVNVHALRNAVYEYRIVYRRTFQTQSYAETHGTFTNNIGYGTAVSDVTQDTFTDADAIGTLSITPPGQTVNISPIDIRFSANYSQPSPQAPIQWWGANVVEFGWVSTGGQRVRIDITYRYGTTSGTNTVSFFTSNASSYLANWTETITGPGAGGISAVNRIEIWSVDGSDNRVTRLRDSRPDLAPVGLVWSALSFDPYVTARFRYKQTSAGSFGSWIDLTRVPGTANFVVDIYSLLAAGGQFNYEIEHLRSGATIAKKEGLLTLNGAVASTTWSGSASPTSFYNFDEYVANPSIAGLTMSWGGPSNSVDATFEYGTSASYGSSLSVAGSSTRSVNLTNLAGGSIIDYYYRITYRRGGRIVSQQTGTFRVNPQQTLSSYSTSASTGSGPATAVPIPQPVGGSSVLTASSIIRFSNTYTSPPGGGMPRWIGSNAVTVNWISTGGENVRVELQYYYNTRNGAQPGLQTRSFTTTNTGATNNFVASWSDNLGDQADYSGINRVYRVLVYSVATGALLRDSFSSATVPGPIGMTWTAPPSDPPLIPRFFYYNGGWIERSVSSGGGNLSVDLTGINGTYTYAIEYYRSGEGLPQAQASGTFVNTGTEITLSNFASSLHNPQWLTVSSSGSTLSWANVLPSGGSVVFEYNNTPLALSSPYNSYNFAGFTPGTYTYRLRYRDSQGRLTAESSGTFSVSNTPSVQPANGVITSTPSNYKYPTQTVSLSSTTFNSNTFAWNFAKQNSGDTVMFRYTMNGGGTQSINVSGSGPSFTAMPTGWIVGTNNLTWWIEYTRAGESDPYAYGSGTASVTATVTTTSPATATVDTQGNAYPTTFQIQSAGNAGGGYFGWATPLESGANVLFSYQLVSGGSVQTISSGFVANGSGLKVDLSSVGSGTYRYWVEYQRNGQPTAYARTSGTLTVSHPEVQGTATRTIDTTPRSDSTIPTGFGIESLMTPNPPNAIWMRVNQQGNPDPFQVPYYIPMPSESSSGGYIRTGPNTWESANPYSQSKQLQFRWTPNVGLDTNFTFEYRAAGSTGAYTTLTGYMLVGGKMYGANIEALAVGNYEFRLNYTRAGFTTPYSVTTGRFTRASTLEQMAVTVDAPVTPPTIVANPVIKQSLDRWGNILSVTGTNDQTTAYRYDTHNQVVTTVLPTVDYLDTRSSFDDDVHTAAPRTYNYFDKLGRLIATRDAHGAETRMYYNAASQMIARMNAGSADFATTGAIARSEYNIFGELAQYTDELGFRTRSFYDGRGRLVAQWREILENTMPGWTATSPQSSMQQVSYSFDEAGRRVRETNGEGDWVRYRYDLIGNVAERQTSMGNRTTYAYDGNGNKTSERLYMGYIGSTAVYSESTWKFDYFGRVRAHQGMRIYNDPNNYFGNPIYGTYTYDYNKAGLLYSQTSNRGMNVKFYFDGAGQTIRIDDLAVARTTNYTYDTTGRVIRERVVVDGLVHQDTKTTYDALNRISTLDDPDYLLQYKYDLVGNRTMIKDSFVNHAGTVTTEEMYYRYDSMNRVLINGGFKVGTPAVRDVAVTVPAGTPYMQPGAHQGYRNSYNQRGDRVSMTQGGRPWSVSGSTYSDAGNAASEVTEYYKYDGLRQLTDVFKETVNATDGRSALRSYTFDKAGRVKIEYDYFIESGAKVSRKIESTYDGEGHLQSQITSKGSTYETEVTFGIASNTNGVWLKGYDGGGTLRGYDVRFINSTDLSHTDYTTRYRYTYDVGESFLQKKETATSVGGGPNEGIVTRYYNVNEELTAAIDEKDASKSRAYANNQQGQVLTTFKGVVFRDAVNDRQAWDRAVTHSTLLQGAGNAQYYFYAGNQLVGSVGSLLTNPQGQLRGNFDVNYTPVSSEYPASAPSNVVVQQGDTLRIIAARIYGDSNLWYLIAEENGLSNPDDALPAGTNLRVPNEVVSLSNAAGVYKPYDGASAIGELTPTQAWPPPPKPDDCQMFGMFLAIVVLVVVTIITYGATAKALPAAWAAANPVLAGAVAGAAGGAAGAVASQAVNIAFGNQDKFDWKGVAVAAIGGAIGGGLSAAIDPAVATTFSKAWGNVTKILGASLRPVLSAGLKAAVVSTLTQKTAIALELQDKFSWRDVAASAVGAMASTGAAVGLEKSIGMGPGVVRDTITGFVGGVASAKVKGGKVDYGMIAVDAFGNAIGSIAGEQLKEKMQLRRSQNELGRDEESKYEFISDEARGLVEPVPMFDPDMMVAGGGMAVGPQRELSGTYQYDEKNLAIFKNNLDLSLKDVERYSAELAKLREGRDWLGEAWDAMPWESDHEEKVAAMERNVSMAVKDVMRFAAIVDLSETTNRIPKRLADATYFHNNVDIDSKSSLLSNALEIKGFVMQFKEKYDGVTSAATNVRRATGILKLFTEHKPVGGLATFVNLFAKEFEKTLKTYGKKMSPITGTVAKGEKIYKITREVTEIVMREAVTNRMPQDRLDALAEVDAIGSSRGQAAAIGFGRGAASIADIVDKRATKTVTETLNPKKWIEDLIDAGQSEIEPIQAPN